MSDRGPDRGGDGDADRRAVDGPAVEDHDRDSARAAYRES
jgi:hypothetical protein